MKNSLKTLVAAATFGLVALAAQAQPAVKIVVVDMAKLYDNHYKTLEQNAKIQADDAKASEEVGKMNNEGNQLVEQYKGLAQQLENPAATAEAKAKAQAEAQKKIEEIQRKQQEVQQFIQNTSNSLRQRLQTFRSLMLEEISKVVADVAKRRGATIVLDKAGPSLIGISNLIYADPGFEITDEVMKEIEKTRPATAPAAPATTTAPAAPAPAPAATTPPPPSGPVITLPGAKK